MAPGSFRNFLILATSLVISAASALADAPEVLISVADQKLRVVSMGRTISEFPISTSRYGLGDSFNSYRTPVGAMVVSRKVGSNLPLGAVLKHKRPTGEILKVNAPGRDPIVTRILCLRGVQQGTRNAEARGIYIHGTPEEKNIGRRASYGCIRMRSRDVAALYEQVGVGTRVRIEDAPLRRMVKNATPRVTPVMPVMPVEPTGYTAARPFANFQSDDSI